MFQLSQVIAGPDAGQWVIVLTVGNWEAYGRAMAGAMADPEFRAAIAQLDGLSEVTGRRLVASVDL